RNPVFADAQLPLHLATLTDFAIQFGLHARDACAQLLELRLPGNSLVIAAGVDRTRQQQYAEQQAKSTQWGRRRAGGHFSTPAEFGRF
ncbi:MAG: hypothetical protein KGL00_08755, partial [Gammaproteobacteria bacterium]|nr:hypothetical protein [Gammaproteobacteria bacterium]